MARNNVIEAVFKADASQFASTLRSMSQAMKALDADLKTLGQGSQISSNFAAGIQSRLDEISAATDKVGGKLADLSKLQFMIDVNVDRIERATSRLDLLDAEIDKLRQRRIELGIDFLGGKATQDQLDVLDQQIEALDQERIEVEADLVGAQQFLDRLDRLYKDVGKVDQQDIDVDVNTTGINQATSMLGGLANALRSAAAQAQSFGLVFNIPAENMLDAAKSAASFTFELAKQASALEQANIRTRIMIDNPFWSGQIFDGMLEYSTRTTSSFEEITNSIARLASSGQVAEGDLLNLFATLDNAAAATGSDVEGISTVISQMYNKGKIYYEELLQLSERNIPAVALLRQELGLTADQMNEMARKGQLGVEEINALVRAMEERYAGTLPQIMDTLNGKLQQIKANAKLLRAELGEMVLPQFEEGAQSVLELVQAMTKLAAAINDVDELGQTDRASFAEGYSGAYNDWANSIYGVITGTMTLGDALDRTKSKANSFSGAVGEGVGGLIGIFKGLAPDLLGGREGFEGMSDSIAKTGQTADREAARFQNAADAVGSIRDAAKEVAPFTEDTAKGLRALGVEAESMDDAFDKVSENLADMYDNFSLLSESAVDLESATSGVAQIFDELSRSGSDMANAISEAIDTSGEFARNLDVTTEGGRALREMVVESVQALNEQSVAQINAGMSAEEATAQYEANKQALIRQLGQLGLNEQAVADFIAQIEKTPTEKQTQFKAILDEQMLRNIIQKYDAAVIDRAAPFLSQLDSVSYGAVDRALAILTQNRKVTIDVAYRVASADESVRAGVQGQGQPRTNSIQPNSAVNLVRVNIAGREVSAVVEDVYSQARRNQALDDLMARL